MHGHRRGGPPKQRQLHAVAARQNAVAVAVLWASRFAPNPGRGYEPRSSRLRTSSVGRLAWTNQQQEKQSSKQEGGPSGQQGSVAPPGDAIRGGSSSRLAVTPGPSVPDRSSRPCASTGWTPVRVVMANWGTFGRHRALQGRCPLICPARPGAVHRREAVFLWPSCTRASAAHLGNDVAPQRSAPPTERHDVERASFHLHAVCRTGLSQSVAHRLRSSDTEWIPSTA